MSSAIYICPTCGCPDLVTPESTLILSPDVKIANCPNCGWEGTLRSAAGILTSENVYDTKAIAQLLFHVTAKHAAGPLAQALQLIGLLDVSDQEGLDKIMRSVCGAMVEAAFTAAGERAVELKEKAEKSNASGMGRHVIQSDLLPLLVGSESEAQPVALSSDVEKGLNEIKKTSLALARCGVCHFCDTSGPDDNRTSRCDHDQGNDQVVHEDEAPPSTCPLRKCSACRGTGRVSKDEDNNFVYGENATEQCPLCVGGIR